MPEVNGKEFPYTPAGKKAAAKAKKKVAGKKAGAKHPFYEKVRSASPR